jgi:hypothetical protein
MQEWRKPDIISKVNFLSYVKYFMNQESKLLFTVRHTTVTGISGSNPERDQGDRSLLVYIKWNVK